MNEDFMKGWNAARECWQTTGSVGPFPPEMEIERTKEASKPPPVKKAIRKPKEA